MPSDFSILADGIMRSKMVKPLPSVIHIRADEHGIYKAKQVFFSEASELYEKETGEKFDYNLENGTVLRLDDDECLIIGGCIQGD